jgi:hypothetical protein
MNRIVIIITTKVTSCMQFCFDVAQRRLVYATPDIHVCGQSQALYRLISVHSIVIMGNLQVLDANQFNPSFMLPDRKSKPERQT